jgi:hypothetical protein
MALYNVFNYDAAPGATESALIVTNGVRKARQVFQDRFGGELPRIVAEPVDTRSNNGERIIGSWLNNTEPAPTAEEVAKAAVLSDDVW